ELYSSAEQDEWEISYQPSYWAPIGELQRKVEALEKIPPSSTTPTEQGLSGSGTINCSIRRLQYLAKEYPTLLPGSDNGSANVALHAGLRSALNGESFTKGKVLQLIEITTYRLGAVHEANYLRQQAKIDCSFSKLRGKTWDLLLENGICTTPIGIKIPWGKPLQYLNLA
ncbi:uncharacterized protein N7483_001215, partial [Penicillium malachiteum]|uniref:uncharacterized protein n=1 Tax=Penicillium malachiteum TaxID=1324776 RepID=UPI0025487AEB